jgi:large subunit ribosomal protein L24
MKFIKGDRVVVTAGKDKGMQGTIVRVLPQENRVVVEGANFYTRHIKPMGERAGQRVRRERALPTASVAIINDKGQIDRIGYTVAKDGTKERIFKKTGQPVSKAAKELAKPVTKAVTAPKAEKTAKAEKVKEVKEVKEVKKAKKVAAPKKTAAKKK